MARADVTINGVEFHIRTFAPFVALRIFGDLQKELLPAVGGLIGAASAAGEGQAVDQGALLQAIKAFSSSLDGKALEDWAARLLDKELITFNRPGRDPRKLDRAFYDDAFDDFASILELLYEVIKLNFAGPLGRWLGLSGSGLTEKLGGLLGGSSQTSSASS